MDEPPRRSFRDALPYLQKGEVRNVSTFRVSDIGVIEKAPTSPASLRNKLSDMILRSVSARAKVELVNQDTGE